MSYLNAVRLSTFKLLGIPDGCGIRSTCWKVLLNYLPYEKNEWKDVLHKQRNAYTQFIKTIIVDPNAAGDGHDHPLSSSPTSIWTGFFKENEVLSQIDKDVRRLCPDLSFFQQPTKFPASFCSQSLRTRVEQANLQSMSVTSSKSGRSELKKPKKKYNDDDAYQILPEGQVKLFNNTSEDGGQSTWVKINFDYLTLVK